MVYYMLMDIKFRMKTQNSGMFCSFGTKTYAITSENKPIQGLVSYYGKLVDIINLNYYIMVPLFKCQ